MISTLLLALAPLAAPQTVSGALFEDVNRNGVRDFGEPLLANVPVTLFGDDGNVDITNTTAADGSYSFTVTTGARCALSIASDPAWRFSFQDLGGDPDPIPSWPQGRARPSVLAGLVDGLRNSSSSAPLLHVALGDSIAFGFNFCDSLTGKNDYVGPITTRLDGVGEAQLSKLAVPGYTTNDLLKSTSSGSIFDVINAGAQLVTLSICGNDFLADDGDASKTAANLVAARQNLQEILSGLGSELPGCDVIVNTIYDNEEGDDAFHNTWGPIWNQMIRDVAWGQMRRVAIAEIAPDYAHLDPATGLELGEDNLICHFLGLDSIHPKKRGYDLHEEKVWQGIGGVDAAAGTTERHFGFVQRIDTRFPTLTSDLGGGATSPSAVFAQDDVGALVPSGDQELRALGFDATPRGLLEQAVVRVRYLTTAPPADDVYRFEVSVDGTFSPAGSAASDWNTVIPVVGGAGNGSAPVLAVPDAPVWREVAALVTKGAAIDGSATITWQDLATLAVRLKGEAAGAADPFEVEWDVAALELWGVPPYRLLARGSPVIGTQLLVDATGREGDDVWLFASGGTGSVPFPPWGTFEIDLTSFLLLGLGSVGPTGADTRIFDLPNDPTLIGVTAYLQALVVESYYPKVGALTNLASVTFE